MALVSMYLEGLNTEHQQCETNGKIKIARSISELMIYNSVKLMRGDSESRIRHSKEREPDLPVYVAMKLPSHTRMNHSVDKFHELGLAISYDRYLQISTNIGNKLCTL